MKISVLGCGRWGSFIAWYLNSIGNEVYSWGPEDGYSYQILKKTGRNEYVALDKKITLTCNLREAVEHADVIVISIGAQGLREFIPKILPYTREEQNFILCMKGIEVDTGKRLSEVMIESGVAYDHIAVWVGPGHIQSFVRGEPNCMVIDSANDKLKRKLADSFKSNLIRFYYGNDLIGTEIGAAAKNVMGIAAGALDAICPSLKGPLITRGAREVATLIKAMGGNELSAYGLALPIRITVNTGKIWQKDSGSKNWRKGLQRPRRCVCSAKNITWKCRSPTRYITRVSVGATTRNAAATRSENCLRVKLKRNGIKFKIGKGFPKFREAL